MYVAEQGVLTVAIWDRPGTDLPARKSPIPPDEDDDQYVRGGCLVLSVFSAMSSRGADTADSWRARDRTSHLAREGVSSRRRSSRWGSCGIAGVACWLC
jgi:hypothetical protein